MSPQRLLKYNPHKDPAELVMQNRLGAGLYKQCKHIRVHIEPVPREMKSLRGNQCLCTKT